MIKKITAGVILAVLFPVLWPLPDLLGSTQYGQSVYDDNNHLLRLTTSDDQKYRLYASRSEIPPLVISTTLFEEDRYFYRHLGINPISLVRAFFQTYILRQRVMGASTITMQVARLRYHLNTRTVTGKILQIFYALNLEVHYSKDEILTAYLNLAPYGHNIEGIKAASLIYFHKDLAQLNLPEILTLVVIPQNPLARTPQAKQKLNRARTNLYNNWIMQHPEDKIYQSHFALPLAMNTLSQLPFKAPHWVDYHLKSSSAQKIDTTLNLPLQKTLESVVKSYVAQHAAFGVNNVSVMLLDSRTMQVKGLVGSGDYFNKNIGGQINGAMVPRSPGSTLKPFIYALALDQGVIHPATVLKDTPMHFGHYDPENFDYQFMGPIKAQDALIQSRNVPAVYLASLLKNPGLYLFLQSVHVPLKSESHYGLGLVLGDAEITMQQLVALYAALPNQGIYHQPRFTLGESLDAGIRVLSPEVSFVTLDMLQQNPRPDQMTQTVKVAWKTGTSSKYRDAWSVGVVGPYVLAVWIGNFDNQSNPSFVGQKVAAPLFFKLVDALSKNVDLNHQYFANTKLNLTRIKVCKDSGLLPTHYCPGTFETWFIPGKSPITHDTVFREVMINPKTGNRACVFDKNNRFVTYEFWPSDILELFRRAGISRRVAPPYDKECLMSQIHEKGSAPKIQSPQDAFTYTLTKNAHNTIPLKANAESGVTQLFWFVNTTYIGKSSADQPLLWRATPGKHTLRVVDNFGRADAVKVNILLL